MLTVKNLRKNFGIRRVLEKVSFSLGEGRKAALVGQNGVGKSTLLRIIAGLESFEKGEVLIPNRALVGYLPQEALPESGETLREYLFRQTGLQELEEKMGSLEPRLDQPETLERYELLQAEYRRLGGYDFERKAHNILDGLCLSPIAFDRPVAELSGGEKRKAALASVLLRGVDILLLDEPTNNLDLPALLWLEKYLDRSKATCLIASHDRRFLDDVVERVVEIDWYKRSVAMYTGGWSDYAEMKAHALRRQKERYHMQEEEKERLLVSMDQKREWAVRVKENIAPDRDKLTSNYKKERAAKKFNASAKALEGREKRLDKIDKPLEREPLVIPLEAKKDEEENSIALRSLRFGYPGGLQGGFVSPKPFEGGPIDLEIPFGTRLAILGNNGAGKSTLLKTVTGELAPLAGEVARGSALRFGYLMQEHENVSQASTPAELFRKRLGIYDRDIVHSHLSQFQFSPDTMDDRIASLSPGERVRLILALLSASGANVLVLDEPTNHLDLETIEALEEALELYEGTVLLVTHDRRFLEKMRLTRSYLLENGVLAEVESYDAYAASIAPKVGRIMKRLEEKHGA